MKKLLLFSLFLLAGPLYASRVETIKDAEGWHLLVDGSPYFVRSVSYHLDVIPQDPNAGTYQDHFTSDVNHDGTYDIYQTWVDSNTNNIRESTEPVRGDFSIMQQMGLNTIRIYHHQSDDPLMTACYPPSTNPEGDLLWNHPFNKTILRDMFNNYGIRFMMGDELGAYTTSSCAEYVAGTDYTDPVQIASMTYSVRTMVSDFKDEPGLLMYVLGNENNYSFTHTNASTHPTEYYTFIGQMVDLIHSLDPYHPVAIANGETQFLSYAKQYAPNLDIFGSNVYRNPGALTGFGTFFQDVADLWDKPVLLTEFGLAQDQFDSSGTFNQSFQAAVHKNYWCDIETHGAGRTNLSPRNAIGGSAYAWNDNWWQNGSANFFYTSNPSNEATGLISQGNGTNSPFLRQPREAWYMYESIWRKGTESCPLPGRSAE